MIDAQEKRPKSLYFLVLLLMFLAVSALGGGSVLIIRPDGSLIGMPLSLLEHSPFPDFLIPGLFLFFVLGVLPLLVGLALLRKPCLPLCEEINPFGEYHWAWSFAFYVGIILILWIDFEVMFIRAVHLLHLIYSLMGVTIVVVAMLPAIRRYYYRMLN